MNKINSGAVMVLLFLSVISGFSYTDTKYHTDGKYIVIEESSILNEGNFKAIEKKALNKGKYSMWSELYGGGYFLTKNNYRLIYVPLHTKIVTPTPLFATDIFPAGSSAEEDIKKPEYTFEILISGSRILIRDLNRFYYKKNIKPAESVRNAREIFKVFLQADK